MSLATEAFVAKIAELVRNGADLKGYLSESSHPASSKIYSELDHGHSLSDALQTHLSLDAKILAFEASNEELEQFLQSQVEYMADVRRKRQTLFQVCLTPTIQFILFSVALVILSQYSSIPIPFNSVAFPLLLGLIITLIPFIALFTKLGQHLPAFRAPIWHSTLARGYREVALIQKWQLTEAQAQQYFNEQTLQLLQHIETDSGDHCATLAQHHLWCARRSERVLQILVSTGMYICAGLLALALGEGVWAQLLDPLNQQLDTLP